MAFRDKTLYYVIHYVNKTSRQIAREEFFSRSLDPAENGEPLLLHSILYEKPEAVGVDRLLITPDRLYWTKTTDTWSLQARHFRTGAIDTLLEIKAGAATPALSVTASGLAWLDAEGGPPRLFTVGPADAKPRRADNGAVPVAPLPQRVEAETDLFYLSRQPDRSLRLRRDADRSQEESLATGVDDIALLAVGPGRAVWTAGENAADVYLLDLAGGNAERLFQQPEGTTVSQARVLSDRIVFEQETGETRRIAVWTFSGKRFETSIEASGPLLFADDDIIVTQINDVDPADGALLGGIRVYEQP